MPIDLSKPIQRLRQRGFQPPWYTVFVYRCERCGRELRIRANAFRGKEAEPGVGAVLCTCEEE